MTDEEIVMARRAVETGAVRWMPGMLAIGITSGLVTHRSRVLCSHDGTGGESSTVHAGPDGLEVRCASEWGIMGCLECAYPDIADPATEGCLLAQVRERYGARVYVRREIAMDSDYRWACIGGDDSGLGWGASEGLAILNALTRGEI